MSKANNDSILLAWLILFVLVLTWGSSFILIKKGLITYTAVQVGVLRIGIASLALLPLAVKHIKRFPKRKWKYILLSGIVGNLIPAYLFAQAETGIDSSLAGVLNSMTPLFTLLLGLAFFQQKITRSNTIGIIVALIGAFGLISVSGGNEFSFNLKYSLLVFIATICYAININMVKRFLQDVPALLITVYAFFVIGIFSWLVLLTGTDFVARTAEHPQALSSLGFIAILAVIGTAVAMILFNHLIRITNAVFASSVTYLMPIMAVIWGVLDGEAFESIFLVWIGLILGGVFLVNSRRRVLDWVIAKTRGKQQSS